MLLRFIIKNRSAGLLLFPLFIAIMWSNHFIHPEKYAVVTESENSVLFLLIAPLIRGNVLIDSIIAILFIVLNSLLLFRIYREYLFLNSWSLLPSILFLLLTGGLPGLQTFHPVWISLLFLILAIDRMFAAFDIRKPYGRMFNSGFHLALGSLFFVPMLLLLPAFIIGSRMMPRDVRWRETVLLLLGTFICWLLALSGWFLTGADGDLPGIILSSFTSPPEESMRNIPLLVYSGSVALLTLTGSFRILKHYDERKVSFRKFYTFFFFVFLSTVLSFLLIPAVSSAIFAIAAVPVTFLLSNYFESSGPRNFGEIIFLMLAGVVVYLQFM